MISKERHEARYQRRKASRILAKAKRNEGYTFDNVIKQENLIKAFYSARKGVNWKASVQKYGANVIQNTIKSHDELESKTYKQKRFYEFDILERGKKRHITSVHISDRVIQKSVCDNGIVPIIEKSLIYDNGASQKGKGTDFARKRLKRHLCNYIKHNGIDGYIVQLDCHDFFASISHDVVEKMLHELIADEELIDLTMQFVNQFENGMGLGSQVCQILAVAYPNKIDHLIKEKLRCKWYGRYMDDSYIIVKTKKEAKEILQYVTEQYLKIGLTMNEKKTQIVKLKHGFIYLQDRYFITETGKIIVKVGRNAVTRNRRKMKKLANRFYRKEITFSDVRMFFASHMGYLQHKNAYRTSQSMCRLFNHLFIERRTWEYEHCYA